MCFTASAHGSFRLADTNESLSCGAFQTRHSQYSSLSQEPEAFGFRFLFYSRPQLLSAIREGDKALIWPFTKARWHLRVGTAHGTTNKDFTFDFGRRFCAAG